MLGALFSFLLIVVISYNWKLIKKYYFYLKSRDNSNFGIKYFVIFCILNFVSIWIIVFGILCATIDWRVMSPQDNAIAALFIGIICICVVVFTYRKNLSFDISKFFKKIVPKSKASLPNISDIVVKFNYTYAFKLIPQVVDNFRDGKASIKDVLNFPKIALENPQFSSVVSKIKYGLSCEDNNKKIQILIISIPNNKAISEVEIAYIVFNEENMKAAYFTLERSINGYAVATPLSNGEHHLIDFVETAEQFVKTVLPLAIKEVEQTKTTINQDVASTQKKNKATSNKDDKVTIISITPLLEFYNRYESMKIGKFNNSVTGKEFHMCLFIDKYKNITEVHFSTTIGELDANHIKQQRDNLQIVELSNGKLILTRKGHISENLIFNPEYVTETLNTITTEVSNFFKSFSLQINLPAYTHRELFLFACSIILGSDNISRIKKWPENLFIEKLFPIFVGEESLKGIIDCMQGMSPFCAFADSMNITSRLTDHLRHCTAVSFEEKMSNGKKYKMLNLYQSPNFYTLVHLSDSLKNLTLQELLDRKDYLYINETCERLSPSAICTPIEEWPILELINRAEPLFIKFITDFIIERIEQYYNSYSSLTDDIYYQILAKVILMEPLNCISELAFRFNPEYDYPILDEKNLLTFKKSITLFISKLVDEKK